MKTTLTTLNGMKMTIETEYEYTELVYANEYEEDVQGLMILWWNPYYRNGKSQIDSEVFPITVEGVFKASSEARELNDHIRRQVEDNTFTFRRRR